MRNVFAVFLVTVLWALPAMAAPEGSGKVTFAVDGAKVDTSVWTFAKFSKANDYNLTTNMHRDKRVLLLNFKDPAPGKTITFGSMASGNYGTYAAAFGKQDKSYQITSGTLTFTKFDPATRTFSATFQFTAAADGKIVRITDGVVTDGAIGPDQLM